MDEFLTVGLFEEATLKAPLWLWIGLGMAIIATLIKDLRQVSFNTQMIRMKKSLLESFRETEALRRGDGLPRGASARIEEWCALPMECGHSLDCWEEVVQCCTFCLALEEIGELHAHIERTKGGETG